MIGPWRAGKFMPLTQRSHSVNTYCFYKVWFKSASIDLRVLDISSITSAAKSWIYADQLEKPEELILYRCRVKGGLNLYNVKLRALAELMKFFWIKQITPNSNPTYTTVLSTDGMLKVTGQSQTLANLHTSQKTSSQLSDL